jgi:hypothetical protein
MKNYTNKKFNNPYSNKTDNHVIINTYHNNFIIISRAYLQQNW